MIVSKIAAANVIAMEGANMDQDTEQAIRERAYFLWKKEGCPEGQDAFFWQRAELMHDAAETPPMVTPLQARSREDARVEEAVAESFPASDPPSFTPEAGIQTEDPSKPS